MATGVLSYLKSLFGDSEPMPRGGPGALAPRGAGATDNYPAIQPGQSWSENEGAILSAIGSLYKDTLGSIMPKFGSAVAAEPMPAGGPGAVASEPLALKMDTSPIDAPRLKLDTNNPFEGLTGAVAEANKRGRSQSRLGAVMRRPRNFDEIVSSGSTYTTGIRG